MRLARAKAWGERLVFEGEVGEGKEKGKEAQGSLCHQTGDESPK